MHRIDGGAGGGQLVRWAVAIGALRDQSVEITNIRGARDPPGLRPQHVAAITAIAGFTDASTTGVEVGSETVTFDPGKVTGGQRSIDVGTAGSITLVFDTMLPLALRTTEPISLTVTGGTDVKWSPPIDYHRHVKLPILAESSVKADIDVRRRGFYPRGGGRATLTLYPSECKPIVLRERGELESVTVESIATEDLEDAEVAKRQATAARDRLEELVSPPVQTNWTSTAADSTGSVVLVIAEYEQSRAGFSALGERGKPAETVAESAVVDFEAFHRSKGAVDMHLADQLLPFLAACGGEVTTTEKTPHVETAADLLRSFGYEVDATETDGRVTITAPGDTTVDP